MTTRFLLDTNVPYGRGGGVPLQLDILAPAQTSAEPRPAVIFVHGGGWEAGNRESGLRLSLLLTKRGFVTATIAYRLTSVAMYPAQIHDVKAAIRFLRAHAAEWHVDPDRIGIWGTSAGGHLTALAALNGDYPGLEGESGTPGVSSRVRCAVPICAPTDFTVPWLHPDGTEATDEEFGPVSRLLGNVPRHVPNLALRASPVALVEPGDAPVLILHGTADPVVPFAQAERLRDAARDAGNEAELLPLPDVGHDVGAHLLDDHGDPFGARSAVIGFFTRHLRPVPPA